MTGFWLAILIIAVGIAAWNVGRWDLRRHLTPADHAAERDRLLDELDESVATGFLAGMVWQARRSRAHARAQRAFLAGGWR